MESKEANLSAVVDTEKKAYRVTFIRNGEDAVTIEYEPGVTPYHDHGKEGSFLDIALNFGIGLDHACGGNCACTTCHVIIKEGEQNVSEME
ncbi:MAG TPA: 2Fe-2S iron-sulfur cluster-binding protein, partial [Blastocatellia bacterium]|nr:2Fe-2S iron-sulfur cluster-binding protein [Blastocatellia bacterium]